MLLNSVYIVRGCSRLRGGLLPSPRAQTGASQLCKYIFLWDRTYCLSKLKGTQDAHPTRNYFCIHGMLPVQTPILAGIATAKVVRTDMNLVETYPSGTLPFGKASPTRTGGTSLLSLS